jgi:hypothetical protein
MSNESDIQEHGQFDEKHYPGVVSEIAGLHRALIKTRNLYKTEIVISFLKSHSLKGEWLKGNGEAARLMSSRTVSIGKLESIFVSCKDNPRFSDALESYIRLEFARWDVRSGDMMSPA